MKYVIIALAGLAIIGGYVYILQKESNTVVIVENIIVASTSTTDITPPAPPTQVGAGPVTSIGTSVEGQTISAYHFGVGEKEIVLIGGMHGGYSWGTSLLGNELVSYFQKNPQVIPPNVTVTIIPTVNPDGLKQVTPNIKKFTVSDISTTADTTTARFNANNVDLNRNFDCKWQATGTWQNKTVSGGSAAFSEPEAIALRDYLDDETKPAAVLVWFSAAGGVYGSTCSDSMASSTKNLMDTFATASEYPAHDTFDSYAVSGDMTNWLASIDVPAISVLLTTHSDPELEKNIAGVTAVINAVAQ